LTGVVEMPSVSVLVQCWGHPWQARSLAYTVYRREEGQLCRSPGSDPSCSRLWFAS